jgi:hypothetical protein
MMFGINPMMMTPVGGGLRPQDVFAATVYSGNGTPDRVLTTGVDLNASSGMSWFKSRSDVMDHFLFDTVRGIPSGLITNKTDAAAAYANRLNSFTSTGLTLGSGGDTNASGLTYVNWSFRLAAKFFDQKQVTHTNGVATNIDLSSLGVIGFALAKITNAAGDWIAWHRSLTAGNNLRLNATAGQSATNAWLSVAGATLTISASAPSGTYIIYGWAHDPDPSGIVQCGSYVGNGASPGPSIALGWKPQYLSIKAATINTQWPILDSKRGISTASAPALLAGSSYFEESASNAIDATASGFQLKSSSSLYNFAGATYIFLAIREPIL